MNPVMVSDIAFKIGYLLRYPGVIRNYYSFKEISKLSFEQQRNRQEQQLARLIKFAYDNVPYYAKLFSRINLTPGDIRSITDLEKLPVLTKQIIKDNWRDFIPRKLNKLKYLNSISSGSTGKPFKYRITVDDFERGNALQYIGWGYAGYKLGDKVAIIGRFISHPNIWGKLKGAGRTILLHKRIYPFFPMTTETARNCLRFINTWQPDFIRGCPSTIYMFAKFIQAGNLELAFKPKAIFATGEILFDGYRKVIEEILDARVFNQYGLNDGGISAYECEEHCGMHINTQRAILEIADEDNKQISNQEGKILATSLYNYALPFIRYDTGDVGTITDKRCTCGRDTPILENILGRTSDELVLGGVNIGTRTYGGIMCKFDIEQYQIIQEDDVSITIRIVKGKMYSEADEKSIEILLRQILNPHVGIFDIRFEYATSIPITQTIKHKYVINLSK